MSKKGGTPQNLTPWKPGQSGNPNGRPKKLPGLRELLADVLGEEKDGKTAAEAILMALRAKAARGDIRAAEVLFDRAYGKPITRTELTGKDGKDLVTMHPAIEQANDLNAINRLIEGTEASPEPTG